MCHTPHPLCTFSCGYSGILIFNHPLRSIVELRKTRNQCTDCTQFTLFTFRYLPSPWRTLDNMPWWTKIKLSQDICQPSLKQFQFQLKKWLENHQHQHESLYYSSTSNTLQLWDWGHQVIMEADVCKCDSVTWWLTQWCGMSMVSASGSVGIVKRCWCVIGQNVEIDRLNMKYVNIRCEMCGWLSGWGARFLCSNDTGCHIHALHFWLK